VKIELNNTNLQGLGPEITTLTAAVIKYRVAEKLFANIKSLGICHSRPRLFFLGL
jgi:hypothetical protein